MSLGQYEWFVLHFPVRPFSELLGKAASPSIKFTLTLWWGWHLPIEFLSFKRFIDQHLCLSYKLSRTPLFSWVFVLNFGMYDYSEGIWIFQWTFWHFPCKLSWGFCSDLLGGLCYYHQVAVFRLIMIDSWRSCGDCYWCLFPYWKGLAFPYRCSSLACFALTSNVLGSFIPAFFSGCTLITKVLLCGLPFYLILFRVYIIFPLPV